MVSQICRPSVREKALCDPITSLVV